MQKAKNDRTKRRNRQIQRHRWKFYHLLSVTVIIINTKNNSKDIEDLNNTNK